MMFGPALPLVLLAIPIGMAVLVFLVGLVSFLRPRHALPRAVVVERARDAR